MANVDLPIASFHLLAWWAVCGALQGCLLLAPGFWCLLLCDSDFSEPEFGWARLGVISGPFQAEVLFYCKVL